MNDSYTTAAKEGKGEYEEKKSVFYGFIKPIVTVATYQSIILKTEWNGIGAVPLR